MNPCYPVAFLSALFFWVWPGLLYKQIQAAVSRMVFHAVQKGG